MNWTWTGEISRAAEGRGFGVYCSRPAASLATIGWGRFRSCPTGIEKMLQLLKPVIGKTCPYRQPPPRRPALSSFARHDLLGEKPLSAAAVHQLVLAALTGNEEESVIQVGPGWLFGPEFMTDDLD